MSQANRAQTMAVKLAAYARRAGLDPAMLVAAYEMSVAHRLAVLGDVFHPDLLHPARTALILLEDAGCTDDVVLAAATLTESEFAPLRLPDARVRAVFGDRVADLVAAVPAPAGSTETLLEELVGLPRDVALIAVAERLDHARHLHFRENGVWPSFLEQIREVYLPLAGRVSGGLQTRLSRWSGAFEERYISRA
jgi:(p)ppGpp synthase/HD superfamily hydrolase